MSSTSHTPGPWIYDSGVFYAACQMDENGMTYEEPIAEMLEGRPFESMGNANLILASPDLLEACELVQQWWICYGMHRFRDEPAAILKVHEAIKKAKNLLS